MIPPYGRAAIPTGCCCKWVWREYTSDVGTDPTDGWFEMSERLHACNVHGDRAMLAAPIEFNEEDEPLGEIVAAFEAGEKGLTA